MGNLLQFWIILLLLVALDHFLFFLFRFFVCFFYECFWLQCFGNFFGVGRRGSEAGLDRWRHTLVLGWLTVVWHSVFVVGVRGDVRNVVLAQLVALVMLAVVLQKVFLSIIAINQLLSVRLTTPLKLWIWLRINASELARHNVDAILASGDY